MTSRAAAYSHGLEKIYDLEVVNPATVRPLSIPVASIQKPSTSTQKAELPRDCDIGLPFGKQFETAMLSPRLDEPIESLALSPFAMKSLTPYGCKTICELHQALYTMKGLGQGHIEEIKEKIATYLGPFPLSKRTTVDFLSLIRIAFHGVDAKDRYFFLHSFSLGQLFPLKPNELHEIDKWSQEMKEKAFKRVQSAASKESIATKLDDIITVFVKRWLFDRGGFAKGYELEERLLMIGEGIREKEFYNTLKILEMLFGESIFQRSLVSIGDDFYVSDVPTANVCARVVERAKSYFYKATTTYPLEKLSILLEREFAILWQGFPEGFIEKLLRQSPMFMLSRNSIGKVFITLR